MKKFGGANPIAEPGKPQGYEETGSVSSAIPGIGFSAKTSNSPNHTYEMEQDALSSVGHQGFVVDAQSMAALLFDFATRLEGTIRSHGVHAAGVVIAPDDIVNYAPLEMAQKGVVSTQYPMGPVEELGLLKMDFLGLSNLTIINNALRIIRKVYKDEIDLSHIPLDDQKT